LTVTEIPRVCVSAPLVAVMLTEPELALPAAATVSVLVPGVVEVTLTLLLLNEQVRPVVPVHGLVRVTVPEKPCTDVTVIVSVVELP